MNQIIAFASVEYICRPVQNVLSVLGDYDVWNNWLSWKERGCECP